MIKSNEVKSTSLKIFKDYKLKSSFPKIKVRKTKDREGAPTPNFGIKR